MLFFEEQVTSTSKKQIAENVHQVSPKSSSNDGNFERNTRKSAEAEGSTENKKINDLETWKKKLITSKTNIVKSSESCKTAKRGYGLEEKGARWWNEYVN